MMISKHPQLQSELAAVLPRPTLQSAAEHLQQAEKSLISAIPYSKFGSDRSDYGFNRIRSHMDELKQLVGHYLDYFVSPESYPTHLQHEYPVAAFGYLHFTANLVHRLPTWQNPMHTLESKGALYELLGQRWRQAVTEVGKHVKEGKVYGAAAVGEWARNLNQHSMEVKGEYGFAGAYELFVKDLGWLIGLYQ
ncbi:Cut8 six-helix bundle-domain-containing protein [Gaertneriomyces semiglobifer]|nr:Cut8 six-helix bundle-domain-containing protein [Gaertneriomyces semiglobifer]